MVRIRRLFRGSPARISVLCALAAFLLIALSGCSVGPIDFGGSTGSSGATGTGGTPLPSAAPTQPGPPPTATGAPRELHGLVVDAFSGQPIEGAEITAGGILTATAGDGLYFFDNVPPGSQISVDADGYAPAQLSSGTSGELTLKLRPTSISGRVTDQSTGKPIPGVLVKLVFPSSTVSPTGTLSNSNTITATFVATSTAASTGMTKGANGLAAPPAASTSTTSTSDEARTTATSVPADTSTPLPPTATPTPKAVPPTGDGFVAVYTDNDGSYFFKDVPAGSSLTFKVPGYKLTKTPAGDANRKDIALEPFKVEGAYITANIASSPDLLDSLLTFISKSRINAVVVNVQDDASAWVFDVKNPEVLKANDTDLMLKDMPALVKRLKDRGLYTIARVVTFQQKTMAEARPDWAVKSSVTGKPWKGGYAGQQRWLDASNPGAQDYMIDMTKEVLGLGFDEIQYDYIRFPSDPAPNEPGDMVFYKSPLTDTGKTLALQSFFKKAHDVIEPTDSFMSADVFGYTLWPDQDGKPILGVIGQVLPELLPYTDYMSPMIYPSHFSPGEQGCSKPATCAYKLVHKSGEFAADVFAGQRAKYRPWLQDFDWPGADYTSPGTTKVAEQMQAAKETGAWGWLWWDASNTYEPRSAFMKK